MKYADNYCTYQEVYEPEHYYLFTGPDFLTKKPVTIKVKACELFAYRQGKKIQDALKSVSPSDREFLMSGISGESWGEIFNEIDGEDW